MSGKVCGGLCVPCAVALLAILCTPIAFLFVPYPLDTDHFAQHADFSAVEAVTTQKRIEVNGVTLNVNVAGPEDAKELVVFIVRYCNKI